MRRTPVDPYAVKAINPFLYKTCTSCGDEFRREPGWLIKYPGANHHVFEKFLCGMCAATSEDAEKFRRTRDFRFSRPPCPPGTPPAPPRRQQ